MKLCPTKSKCHLRFDSFTSRSLTACRGGWTIYPAAPQHAVFFVSFCNDRINRIPLIAAKREKN